MITPEEKAQIARENGAKSKGPTTQEGKDRSRANGLKHGQRSTTLRHLAEPHPAILCNEDSRTFFQLFHNLIKFYQPIGQVPLDIVREIAIARHDLTRVQLIKASTWNRALIGEQVKPVNLPDELKPVEHAMNVALALAKSDAIFDRQIDKLHARIAKLEKRLRYVNQNFPQMGTQPESAQPEEADYNRTDDEKPQATETEEDTETTLFTDDPSEATREAYEYFFPGRKLVVIKPEPN